jgi:hypothetical protein
MSKFLLNLLLQISKAMVYLKIKLLFRKEFFLTFGPTGPAASRPIRPFGPAAAHLFLFSTGHSPPLSPLGLCLSAGPARTHGPTGRLLPPPTPEPSAQAAAAGRPRAAPQLTPTTSTGRKIMVASLLHSPIKRRHFPSSIPSNRRLQSGGIEASSTPTIEGTWPPPPHLCPIKGRPALGEDSHTSNAPPLSPQCAPAAALPS